MTLGTSSARAVPIAASATTALSAEARESILVSSSQTLSPLTAEMFSARAAMASAVAGSI